MVLMLQNLLHYTGDYIWKDQSLLSHDNYPAQNPDFIDKLLFVPYRDENTLTVNFRLPVSKKKHPEFDGHKGPYENYTRVLRFDMGEPYVAILVDTLFNIIVADTRELLKYKIYPRYRYSRYKGFDEAFLPMASNWPEFNEEYNSEKMWIVHVSNDEWIGKTAYVEYFKDLVNLDHGDTIIQPSERSSDETPRHNQDFLDKVYRAKEKGYIIRADENGTEAQIVVMVVDEESGTRKFVLGTEAYFYIDSDDTEQKKLEELELWQ